MKKEQLLQLLELAKQADELIHRSMPPGGNANHEAAQQTVGQLVRQLTEATK